MQVYRLNVETTSLLPLNVESQAYTLQAGDHDKVFLRSVIR